ncbi:uncharacterized protein [Vicugna pacos]|uniref:Uncharacterized protein n=1 Tax=Vicugna pacos TaxID=30538 RepID=A0ABM5BZT1_VICPA
MQGTKRRGRRSAHAAPIGGTEAPPLQTLPRKLSGTDDWVGGGRGVAEEGAEAGPGSALRAGNTCINCCLPRFQKILGRQGLGSEASTRGWGPCHVLAGGSLGAGVPASTPTTRPSSPHQAHRGPHGKSREQRASTSGPAPPTHRDPRRVEGWVEQRGSGQGLVSRGRARRRSCVRRGRAGAVTHHTTPCEPSPRSQVAGARPTPSTCPRTASGPAPAAAMPGTKPRGRRLAHGAPPGGTAPPPLQPLPLAGGSRAGARGETRRAAARSTNCRLPS